VSMPTSSRKSLVNLVAVSLLCALLGLASSVASAQPVKITFAWWGNPAIAADYQALFDRFQELNPDIVIEQIRWGYSADAQEQFTVQVATNTAPDVFMIPTIFEEALLPLDALLERTPELARQLLPDGLTHWRIRVDEYGVVRRGEGQQLGLPLYSFATAIAYNQDMFSEAGIAPPTDWTYEEFEQAARQLTRDTDGDGTPNVWGTTWHLQSDTGLAPIVAAHGEWPLFTDEPFDTIIDSPQVREGFEVIRRWMQESRIHRTPAEGTANFPAGQVATIQGHNDTFLGFPQSIGDQFKWDVAPMPIGPRGRTSVAFHQGIGINAKTEHPDEAWRFVQFFLGEEGAVLQNRSILRLSSNVFAAQDYVDRAPFSADVLIDSFNDAVPTAPGVPIGVNVAQGLYPVWNGEESVESAVERLAQTIRANLAQLFSR